MALAVLFPLAQVTFFGLTDYRRPADAAVVLGAKVHDDGRLSSSLRDRVDTGIELYREGLVPTLVMSGGIGANGVDEAVAMRDYAVSLGVPADDILCDSKGVNTDATVRNTLDLLGDGTGEVLVVSQFYHLPRIKLAYQAAGRRVYTVPAGEKVPIGKTPLFVAREVPGFWVYWTRAIWRDVRPPADGDPAPTTARR
jgi:vancomycin permeability regulator SanA